LIPKGFSYFSVDFGLQSGFAHIVEDENTFSSYFGQVCFKSSYKSNSVFLGDCWRNFGFGAQTLAQR
jgi:hypothetical protein